MASLSTIVNTMKMLVYCACQSLKVSHVPIHVWAHDVHGRQTEFDHGIIKIFPLAESTFPVLLEPTLLNCSQSRCRDLTCPTNNSCIVDCIHENQAPCGHSNIMCPTNHRCTVNCEGIEACSFADITCPQLGNCTTNCKDHSACRFAEIYCPDNQDCFIDCDGRDACTHSQVRCPVNHSCTVNCNGQNSCGFMNIECSDAYDCIVNCSGSDACNFLSVRNSTMLNLSCCSQATCRHANVQPTSTICN